MAKALPISNNEEINESLNIEQDYEIYTLTIKIKGELMVMNVTNSRIIGFPTYSRQMTLKDIKEIHVLFSLLHSFKEFIEFLKNLSKFKKLSIAKKADKLSINFIIEYSSKKYLIEIILAPDNNSSSSTIYSEINIIKEKMKNLEKESNNIKEELNEFKKIFEPISAKLTDCIKINKYISNEKSSILLDKEYNMIKAAIKDRLKKEVKEIKKLYQAAIDGDGPINFHSRCDNIPNTLTFIKSAGNRRFGGFTTQTWDSSDKYKDDKNAFLFSLDKQKIYPCKNKFNAIFCRKDGGPNFGYSNDIYIGKNPIQSKKLYTYESHSNCSYNYNGDKNALSEDGKASCIYAIDYEVFQVIFS